MGNFIDLSGQRFAKLVVLHRVPNFGRRTMYKCKCDCGNEIETRSDSLKTGNTQSCGCIPTAHYTHGLSRTKSYRAYRSMLNRCLNPNRLEYHNYGGRGIEICQRWLDSFVSFYEDMGDPPKDLTLDRIDNSKNYEPSNCRWATRKEQAYNRRTTRLITYNGTTLNHTEWAEKLGGGVTLITSRLRRGWSKEKAVSTPVK